MKIAFLNLYSGVNNRGAESFVHELATRLAGNNKVHLYAGGQLSIKDIQVKVVNTKITQPQQGFYALSLINQYLKLVFLDSADLAVLVFSLKIFRYLWKEKYDIVIPINGFWQVLVCRIATWFYGGKVVITGHSGPGWDERWNLYLKPDVFVASTPSVYDWAKSQCFYTRLAMIPYGVDIERFEKAKPLKIDLERPIILCPSASVPYKRVDTAIKATAKLKKGSLLHLGDGILKEKIMGLGNKLLGARRFLSLKVPSDEMPSYYKSADLVTLPSTSQENSPMVFLEAMASGKMTVATDAPRPRWILGKAGIFVEPENTEEYAEALEKGLSFKDFDLIKKRAEKFSWNTIAGKYEELFQSISPS